MQKYQRIIGLSAANTMNYFLDQKHKRTLELIKLPQGRLNSANLRLLYSANLRKRRNQTPLPDWFAGWFHYIGPYAIKMEGMRCEIREREICVCVLFV